MPNQSRRDFLRSTALTATALTLSPFLTRPILSQNAPRKKVLFFTKSAGFQHSVITRPKSDPTQLSYAEKILADLAAKSNIDLTCSKDGSLFTPDYLAGFDAFAFYTTGDLTKDSDKFDTKKNAQGKDVPDPDKLLHKEPGMGDAGKQAFLDAIKNGKGFVGFHAATDTFHSPKHVKGEVNLLRDVDAIGEDQFDPYIQMIGGEFIIHGKQQPATLRCIDPNFSGAKAFDGAKFPEEWYSLKNFSPDLHVILAQDTAGMTGKMYERPLFPETWARMHGQGRVFYTSMGHREDVWQKPEFLNLVTSALLWTTRRIDADTTPNYKTATPQAEPKST